MLVSQSVSTMKLSVLVVISVLLVAAEVNASPYNKYGRTCRDILCIAGQEDCVMEQDACTAYSEKCGSYPTCKRKATATKRGCASIRCEAGQFCSIRQENCSRPPCEIKPVCIAFRTPNPTKATSVMSRPTSNTYNFGQQTGGGRTQYGQQQYGQNYGGRTQPSSSSGKQYSSWSWGSG